MDATKNLKTILNSIGFDLSKNIAQDISHNLSNNNYANKHVSFLLDLRTRKVLSYAFNIYYRSDSFPFSVHAEIESITKYYKGRSVSKNKKVIIVVKLSKTGIIGNSKLCLNCSRFVKNNFENLNLKKIYYSVMQSNTLVELGRDDLIDSEFKYSKGFDYKQRNFIKL